MAIVARKLLLHSMGKVALGSGGEVVLPTTLYFYPDADPETSSFDGDTGRYRSTGDSWADVHDGAGNDKRDLHTTMMPCYIQAHSSPGQWRLIWRNEILFDTSVIPIGKTIISAELSICGYNEENGLGADPAINVFTSDPLSNVGASDGDYHRFGSTPLCDTPITWATWQSGAIEEKRNVFQLNAAGLAAIIKGGITKLAVLEINYDLANTPPPWVDYQRVWLQAWSSDKGDPWRPCLKVTYV